MTTHDVLILPLEDVQASDVGRVGGKNASLGEMIRSLASVGVRVPPGFALTAQAWRRFLADNDGLVATIEGALAALDDGRRSLAETGHAIRNSLRSARVPDDVAAAARAAYADLCRRCDVADVAVAVRSSATAEDLPDASFAGQQESFLNISGADSVVDAVHRCFVSLYTDRAIAYRSQHGFRHLDVALSVGVQQMVRSDLGSAGVIFTLDPESGHRDVVVVTSAWGLGENLVQGTVGPDEFVVWKRGLDDPARRPILRRKRGEKERTLGVAPGRTVNAPTPLARRTVFSLDDADVLQLARWAVIIERHYGRPMDIEWAKDGFTGELFVVQARPETVQAKKDSAVIVRHRLTRKGIVIVEGAAVGEDVVAGTVCRIDDAKDVGRFKKGAILLADRTDPDWVPALRQASGVITAHGGRTCHAAIVARELGIPAVVGAVGALDRLRDGDAVTLSCAEGGRGRVYFGTLPFVREEIVVALQPTTRTKVMLNIADPDLAFAQSRLPVDGVGLVRLEFLIGTEVGIHPMALAHPEKVSAAERSQILARSQGFASPAEFFVDTIAGGVGRMAAAFHPRPVIVRLSDFKSNEYETLLGGVDFEPDEENPMIGFRGASRYANERYADGFALECRALKKARDEIGCDNIALLVPFCRTPEEGRAVLDALARHGLVRGERGLEVWVMCEVPSNVLLAEEFAALFDGFSIGSNDLTQLVLGVDRDSEILGALFDERNPAVTSMIVDVIERVHACGKKVGICGEAPSVHEGFAALLVEAGIDSISLNPDSVVATRAKIAAAEAHAPGDRARLRAALRQPDDPLLALRREHPGATR